MALAEEALVARDIPDEAMDEVELVEDRQSEGIEPYVAPPRVVSDISEPEGIHGKSASTMPSPCPAGKRGELVRRACFAVADAAASRSGTVFDRRRLPDESLRGSL